MEESNRAEESDDLLEMDRAALRERIRDLERELSEYREIAKALAISEERYALAIRGTHDGIWDWEVDSETVSFSPRFNVLLGYPEDRTTGQFAEFTSRLHPDDLAPTQEAIRAHLVDNIPYDVEYRLRHKDGRYIWFHACGDSVRDASGKPVRMAGAVSDITRRKEVEQQLDLSSDRLRIATRAGGIGVFDYDIVKNILVWDEEMYRMYGVDPEQFSGAYEAWEEGVHPDDLPEQRKKLQSAMRGETEFDSEFRVIWPSDGSIHYITANAKVLRDEFGHAIRMIGANWDITESRRTQEELHIARERAEAAASAKSQFLANMSHEIRTPLNGIIGLGELLGQTGLDEVQLEFVNLISQSSESLRTIIDDILDFSKIEAGKLVLDPHEFMVRDTVADILQTLGIRAAEKGLELSYRVNPDVPDILVGDSGRIRQVLLNLAGNGIKFTPAGSVHVEARLESRQKDHVVLHFLVKDTGIGIPLEKQETIFESFTQAESSTTKNFGGTGLGLSISHRLVELMEGRIWVESEPGKGSTFYFTIRLGVNQVAPESPPGFKKLKGNRVLVVVGDSTNRQILEEMLSGWEMKTELAAGGAEALAKLAAAQKSGVPIPFLILDLEMPELEPMETVHKIREQFPEESLEILALNTLLKPEGREELSRLGIKQVLNKPVKQSELCEALLGTFDSPSRGAQEDSPGTPPESSSAVRPMNLLLAEDTYINRIVAVKLLEGRGHTVTVSEDGKIAVERFLEGKFDAILMDLQMPNLDGFGATAAIRKVEEKTGAHIPIIAMTANAMRGDRQKCLDAGMDEYVAKPIRSELLFSIVEKFSHGGAGEPVKSPGSEVKKVEVSGLNGESEIFDSAAFSAAFSDLEMMVELIEIFPLETGRYLEAARKALGANDAKNLNFASHSLKGTIGVYEASRAMDSAVELYSHARNGDLKAAAGAFDHCEREVAHLDKVLREFRETLK